MKIPCELSVRHVHISEQHAQVLFGGELGFVRELSQPGQFLSDKRVDLVTPKATIKGVAVLAPYRKQTQVEISRSDCFTLGLKNVPVRQSGDLENTPGIILRSQLGEVTIDSGVVVAQRHIHMTPKVADEKNLVDNQIVSLRFGGKRGGTLENVVVRVDENYAPMAHIDSDEANALGFVGGECEIVYN